MPIPTERNECGVITIFPMYVSCNSTNPSSSTASDGIASLFISGGTPPYLIQWNNGSIGQSINNLSSGSYVATVTDSNGDYLITSTCNLLGPTPIVTPTPVVTPTPLPLYDFCLTFTPSQWNYFYNRS